MDDAARVSLKRSLANLRAVAGAGTTLVSLYIAPGKQVSDVVGRLRGEIAEASNIKSRTTRHGVEEALTTAASLVSTYKAVPANGLAVFAGAGEGVVVEPPEPITLNIYRCEPKFLLEPLEEMLESTQRYGLIAVDRGEFTVGLLHGKRYEMLDTFESHIMGKHQAGGQSAHRYERQIEHATEEFYGRAGERANEIFVPMLDRLNGILVGGPGYGKNEIEPYLDYRVKKKLVRPFFDIGYTGEQGLRELVGRASKTIQGLEISAERELVNRFFVGINTGKAVYGEQEVLCAIGEGRAGIVLVSESRETQFVVDTHLGIMKVEIIGEETEEGRRFKLMGGIGAILRW